MGYQISRLYFAINLIQILVILFIYGKDIVQFILTTLLYQLPINILQLAQLEEIPMRITVQLK